MSLSYDYLFRFVFIGDSAVGKSSLLARYADNEFQTNFLPTIGVDFKIKTVDHSGEVIKIQMWDTAGQDRFRTITSSYYRSGDAIVICYDITDKRTFENVDYWMRSISQHVNENVIKILIGNKSDLEHKRQVQFEDGKELANKYDMEFIETSAKTSQNVEIAFNRVIESVYQQKKKPLKNNVAGPCVLQKPLQKSLWERIKEIFCLF